MNNVKCREESLVANNKNNGMITKIWGPYAWKFGHMVTFGFPTQPTSEQQYDYYIYFRTFGKVLPCKYCRESYDFITTRGSQETLLTRHVVESRTTITKWFYEVHEAVNRKLGVDFKMSYDQLVCEYEGYRAKCGEPKILPNGHVSDIQSCEPPSIEQKIISFQNAAKHECPVFDNKNDDIYLFISLAHIRGIRNVQMYEFYSFCVRNNWDFNKIRKNPIWEERNKYCYEKIQYIRTNGINTLERNGIWIGTPTWDELELLIKLCSTYDKKELKAIAQNVRNNKMFIKNLLG